MNHQRKYDRLGDIAFGVPGFFAHRGDGFETHQDQDRDTSLHDHEAEPVRMNDRSGTDVMAKGGYVLAVGILRGRETAFIADRIELFLFRDGIHDKDRVALFIDLRFRGGGVHDHLGRVLRIRDHFAGIGLSVLHILRGSAGGIHRPGGFAFLDLHTMRDRHDREDNQRGDLHDVDGGVDARRAAHTSEGDVSNTDREERTENQHHQGAGLTGGKRVGKDLPDHVTKDDRRDTDHHPGIHPVIKMAGPPDDEFHQSSPLERLILGEKRLLREEVAGPRPWIELGEFGVSDRGGQT